MNHQLGAGDLLFTPSLSISRSLFWWVPRLFPPCRWIHFHWMRTLLLWSRCEPASVLSLDTEPPALILDFPITKISLVCKLSHLWYFVTAVQTHCHFSEGITHSPELFHRNSLCFHSSIYLHRPFFYIQPRVLPLVSFQGHINFPAHV